MVADGSWQGWGIGQCADSTSYTSGPHTGLGEPSPGGLDETQISRLTLRVSASIGLRRGLRICTFNKCSSIWWSKDHTENYYYYHYCHHTHTPLYQIKFKCLCLVFKALSPPQIHLQCYLPQSLQVLMAHCTVSGKCHLSSGLCTFAYSVLC